MHDNLTFLFKKIYLCEQGSKESKTAWKLRKQAIDEVDGAVKKCTALLDTSQHNLKRLAELLRALRDRLTDSQSNLKVRILLFEFFFMIYIFGFLSHILFHLSIAQSLFLLVSLVLCLPSSMLRHRQSSERSYMPR